MAPNERVRLGETSSGRGARGQPGRRVDLPVDEVLGGRGLVAGEPGSGASNTAGLLARAIADRDHGLLVVDDTGEYTAMLAGREFLHVGATGACDLRLDEDRAGPLAELAFEGELPVVFDRSTYRDAAAADAALAALSRRLFAVAEERPRPFLVVLEGLSEYLPDGDPEGDLGRILRRVARRGGARGLGVLGVSRRPADVDRAFVESCDWRVWHRLTRHEETMVLRRRVDGERASAVRGLSDREAFLVAGRADDVRRVEVDHVPAGHGRPPAGSDGPDRLEALRDRLDERGDRIAALEARLETAREVDDAADRFVDRLLDRLAESSLVGRERSESDRTGRDGTERPTRDGDGEARNGTDGVDEDAMAAFGDLLGDGTDDPSPNGNGSSEAAGGEPIGSGFAALAGAGAADEPDWSDDTSGGSGSTTVEDRDDGVRSPRPSVGAQVADFERGASAGVLAEADPTDDADGRPAVVARLVAALESLDEEAIALVEHYREEGPDRPADAHEAVTGWPDRVAAYRVNRELRRAGLVEHVGRGYYDYCLPATVREGCEADRSHGAYARDVEQEFLEA